MTDEEKLLKKISVIFQEAKETIYARKKHNNQACDCYYGK